MTERPKAKEDSLYKPEEYKCIEYTSRLGCKTCDGFGRNLDSKVNTEECYKTKDKVIGRPTIDEEFPRA